MSLIFLIIILRLLLIVDEDTFLHNETDPRYRGAAIPSRAFRMLQTMTDSASDPIPQYSNGMPSCTYQIIYTFFFYI